MLCGVPTPFVPLIKKVCAVSPPSSTNFSVRCPPLCNSVPLPHLALSWILSKVENLESSSLQDEATHLFFFSVLFDPSLIIINLAQLVSPSVELLAEIFCYFFSKKSDFY